MIFRDRARLLAARLLPWVDCVLVALVCWQAAGLVWQLFAPATAGPMPVPPRPGTSQTESRDAFLGWFGGEVRAEARTTSAYTLMAVIAGEQDGVAVLKGGDGKSVAVRTGTSVDSGSLLVAVEPAGATIESGGIRQEIKLPQTQAHSMISSAPARPGAPAAANAIRVTHGRMVAVMRGGNVAGWDKGLSDAPDGGIRVDRVAVQPFAGLLQLKDGDVLKKVNQRPLARVADVSLLFFHFGQSSPVVLELIRGGAPMTQRYDILP